MCDDELMEISMGRFDDDWQLVVCARLDPLFSAADSGFTRSTAAVAGELTDMLWETDPHSFAARYPDSGIEESYGPGWPPPCIDFWIYVDAAKHLATLSTEGLHARFDEIPLTGRSAVDAQTLSDVVASALDLNR